MFQPGEIRYPSRWIPVMFALLCTCGDGPENSRKCNNDAVCDSEEHCLWCQDCCTQCSVNQGPNHDYIVDELLVHEPNSDTWIDGLDLDGDGEPDNRLGSHLPLLAFGDNAPNPLIATRIEAGSFIMLVRLVADDVATNDSIALHIFAGDEDPTHDATEDNLTGLGHALIAPGVDRSQHFCGTLSGGEVVAQAHNIMLRFPIFGFHDLVPMTLRFGFAVAVSEGWIHDWQLERLIVGGGVEMDCVINDVIPAIVAFLNAAIRDDPEGDVRWVADVWLDGQCDNTIEGCQDVVNAEGECAVWGGPQDPNPPVTETELWCGQMHPAFEPDIDVDGDGKGDLLSFAFMVSALPITIDN